MSTNAPSNIGFDFAGLSAATSLQSGNGGNTGNSAAFDLQLQGAKAGMLKTLLSSAFGTNTSTGASGADMVSTDQLGGTGALSPSGMNTSLFDPVSAYNMMTQINNFNADFKAQYAELGQMGTSVSGLQQAAQTLGQVGAGSGSAGVASALEGFATQYNAWVSRFSGDVQQGGLLANTQAAQESVYELQQSVGSVFNGAAAGFHGMADIGLSINASTGMVQVDTSKLDSSLAANRQGVVATIQQFSANFATSASLLNSTGNFIPDQLSNLGGAISYIGNNETSLQAEFGTGDPATPSAQVAQALAMYQQSSGA